MGKLVEAIFSIAVAWQFKKIHCNLNPPSFFFLCWIYPKLDRS